MNSIGMSYPPTQADSDDTNIKKHTKTRENEDTKKEKRTNNKTHRKRPNREE